MGALGNIKISKFQYEEKIPSTGKKVLITPFRVGDEKVLLEASQSDDAKHMQNAIKQVIGNCVTNVNVDDLTSFDLEYLFLRLRSKSVGETSEIGISCKECESSNKITVNLDSVNVYHNPDHSMKVKVQDDLMFEMKYPDTYSLDFTGKEGTDAVFEVIYNSIKTVYYGEEAIEITEGDKEDFITLINEMNKDQFDNIQKFFETMPKLRHVIDVVNPNTKVKSEVLLEGLPSFLG